MKKKAFSSQMSPKITWDLATKAPKNQRFRIHTHGKRSDKETQSPMLKIFKDMMQNEKTDPEKTNLLKEKHLDKKRKHYSGSRSKSGHKAFSSSSDRQHRSQPFKMQQQETRTAEFDSRSRSIPFQNEKRDSWWFWRDTDVKSKAEDTCSCVSCALKKLINTDYACIACLVILFTVSVIVAIMLLYKSVPCIAANTSKDNDKNSNPKTDNERWKRKIDGLKAKFNFGSKAKNPFLSSHDLGFGSFNIQESNLVDSNSELSRILDNDKMNEIQNSDRLKGFYEKLIKTDAAIRNLRKSLNTNSYSTSFDPNSNIEFNSKIDFNSNFDFNSNAFSNSNIDLNSKVDIDSKTDFDSRVGLNRKSYLDYPDRLKRSIKLFHRPLKQLFRFKKRNNNNSTSTSKIDNGKVVTKTTINMTTNKKPKLLRNKRYGDFNDTEGFVIEKNKVVIQYLPIHNRVVAKCSHAPKDSKSHETQLKHPFYKNTQRLDELLDQFIDKKLPDLLLDHFDTERLKENKIKSKRPPNKETIVKGPNFDSNAKVNDKQIILKEFNRDDTKNENKQIVKIKSVGNGFENDFFDDSDGVDKAKDSTTSSYDILLSISTLINPTVKRTSSHPASMPIDRVPSLRKLMQADVKEGEGVAYEDLKEVLADDKEGHDETDKDSERKKRNDDESPPNSAEPVLKHSPISVHNPNWKGPMPLYPDELNQFIKQEQSPNSKVITNKNSALETQDSNSGLTDMQYVEDYLDNGYEKLTQLAQAYSDYGVLDEKKETDVDRKISNKENHKYQDKKLLTMHGFRNGLKRGLKKKGFFERLKKGTDNSEGIRIELQPTSETREDNSPSDLYKLLRNHVKITNAHNHHGKPQKFTSFTPSSALSHLRNLNFPYYSKVSETARDKMKKSFDPLSNESIFPVNKKRTLKSIEFDNENDVTEVPGNNFGNNDFDKSKFKREANMTLKNGIDSNIDSVNETAEDNALKSNKVLETKGNLTLHALNSNSKIKGRNMTLSDFFMYLSDWFSSLDGVHVNVSKSTAPAPVPRGEGVVIQKRDNESAHSEMVFPTYDSDMIENIGHRSRVLLSVHVSNNTKNENDNLKSDDVEETNAEVSTSAERMNSNTTNAEHKITNYVMRSKVINENNSKNRIVKRQAMDDSNLIFWNDLYDDEYGVQVDPFEKNIRDKHSIDKSDFLKRSNTWIQDKVKQIAGHLNLRSKKDGKRISRDTQNVGVKNFKRNENYAADDEPGTANKVDFKTLTEKMREVCKKTVKDVQQTKNIQARGENKEGHVVSTLMQQLVRLMTDLVDFQVQERTCRRLPADLQVFLDWLTSSKQEDQTDFEATKPLDMHADIQHKRVIFEKPTENDVLQPVERNTDSKTDCLGTLHAVQDLIRQYEDMSDDDKSLMIGVKNYLENQMSYLQKQLSSINEYKPYDKDAIRYRREASTTDIAQTISDATDAAVQTAENEYKHLKSMYKKYMKKLKHVSGQVTEATASVKEAVTKGVKKVSEAAKACKHKYKKIKEKQEKEEDTLKEKSNSDPATHKSKHKDKSHSKDKVHFKGRGRNKENDDNKDHVNEKDNKDNSRIKEKEHAKDKDREDTGEDEEEETKSEAEHPNRNKEGRNIKDVYYKAVEEAKKSSVKNTHKRSDLFDTTELLRINK